MKLSGVIIAKNEEKMIEDCIRSLKFCDEVLVVLDKDSTDRTKEITLKLGARVAEGELGDFARRRNIGMQKAEGEWVLYVDADERVSEDLAFEIKERIRESTFSAYKILRKNYYFGDHPWPYIEKLERLFLKEKFIKWRGELHESPEFEGEVGILKGYLYHYTHRDLSSMVEKTNKWSETEALLRFNTEHPKMSWWRFPRVMLTEFFRSYIKQSGWKAGTAGLIESIYQAFSIFITYAKLWELQNLRKK